MKKIAAYFILIIMFLLVTPFVINAVQAHTNTFTLPWSVISAGGLGGSSEGYTINSSLGQPVAGMVAEGDYSLTPGFWTRLDEVIEEFLTFLPLIMR